MLRKTKEYSEVLEDIKTLVKTAQHRVALGASRELMTYDEIINLAKGAIRDGDYDMAIKYAARAVRVDGVRIEAYQCRGIAYTCKHDFDACIRACNKAIERDPKSALSYSARGWAYRLKGDLDAAIQNFEQILECDPASPHTEYVRRLIRDCKQQVMTQSAAEDVRRPTLL